MLVWRSIGLGEELVGRIVALVVPWQDALLPGTLVEGGGSIVELLIHRSSTIVIHIRKVLEFTLLNVQWRRRNVHILTTHLVIVQIQIKVRNLWLVIRRQFLTNLHVI